MDPEPFALDTSVVKVSREVSLQAWRIARAASPASIRFLSLRMERLSASTTKICLMKRAKEGEFLMLREKFRTCREETKQGYV